MMMISHRIAQITKYIKLIWNANTNHENKEKIRMKFTKSKKDFKSRFQIRVFKSLLCEQVHANRQQDDIKCCLNS